MIYIVQNALPIIAAALAGFIAANLYYRCFGREGIAASRHGSVGRMVSATIAQLWFAAILAGALILAPPKAAPWIMAIGTAVVIWIGFVVPALVVTLRHRGLPPRTVAIDCGMWLVLMVTQALVLKLVGLVPPAS